MAEGVRSAGAAMPLPAARRLLGRKVAARRAAAVTATAGNPVMIPELGMYAMAPPGHTVRFHFPNGPKMVIGGEDAPASDGHVEPAVDRLLLGCVSAFALDLVYCCLTARSVLSGVLAWVGQLASFVLSVYR